MPQNAAKLKFQMKGMIQQLHKLGKKVFFSLSSLDKPVDLVSWRQYFYIRVCACVCGNVSPLRKALQLSLEADEGRVE